MIFTFISIFIVEITIYGIFSYYGRVATIKRENHAITETVMNVKNSVQVSIDEIDHRLEIIEMNTKILQSSHGEIFSRQDVLKGEDEYLIHSNGAMYNEKSYGASLYYNTVSNYDDKMMQRVYKTEQMDSLFKILIDSNDLIQQIYFNGHDNLNRMYPYVHGLADVFGPDVDVERFPFYYLANKENNPTKEIVWTPLYKDPAGLGWVVSCIAPIYNNQLLEGVSGIDLEIKSLVNNILKISIDYPHRKLLFDNDFNLITIDGSDNETLRLDRSDTLYFEDEETLDQIKTLFNEKSSEWRILMVDGVKYFAVPQCINTTKWKLLILIDYEKLHLPIVQLGSDVDRMLRITNLILVLLTSLFVFLAYVISKRMARNLVLPLQDIEKRVIRFTEDRGIGEIPSKTGIQEIDLVNEEIYTMMKEIIDSTEIIIKANEEKAINEVKMNCLHEYSYKDMLTDLYNRRKMEDLLDAEIERGLRYGNTFAFLLIDIDFFKRINDNYGHNTGDLVLKELANLIASNLRETDILSRWGGEEFVILCQDSSLERGVVVAEKIREIVDAYHFVDGIRFSVSIGVVEFRVGLEDKYTLFKRVDELLYYAKENGRNRVSYK